MTDTYQPGAYWQALLESQEDDELFAQPPDSAELNVDIVSRQLGWIRKLQRRLADYDRLHQAELDRLNRNRAAAVGGIVNQIARLERSCEQFAVKAFEDFGRTTTQTPNGIIKVGRARLDDLTVVDHAVEKWLRPVLPGAVLDHPKILVAELRELLSSVSDGMFAKAVRWTNSDGEACMAWGDDLPAWEDGYEGVYVDLSGEGLVPEVLPGLTWTPQPRKITVVAA